jgi:hypothetical protein
LTAFKVDFEWEEQGPIRLDTDGKVAFPRRMPIAAGVYRFRLTGVGQSAVYIGETVNLRQRMAGYRNPGPTQPTNKRMNARLREHLAADGRVQLSMARRVAIVAGERVIEERLDHTPQRRLVENLALIEADAEGIDQIENL